MTGHRRTRLLGAGVALLTCAAPAASAAEPPPFPAEPAAAARAAALRALPCLGGDAVDGFAPAAGVPSPWRLAGALVSVRRDGPDRFAFVLDPPQPGATECAVRDVIVLPRRGEMLACALPDESSQGMGVHTQLPSGRRDVVFWRADGTGGFHRLSLDEAGLETDTGQLICALPDAMP